MNIKELNKTFEESLSREYVVVDNENLLKKYPKFFMKSDNCYAQKYFASKTILEFKPFAKFIFARKYLQALGFTPQSHVYLVGFFNNGFSLSSQTKIKNRLKSIGVKTTKTRHKTDIVLVGEWPSAHPKDAIIYDKQKAYDIVQAISYLKN